MFKLFTYCLVVFLWLNEGTSSEKATVPDKICQRKIVHQMDYKFNSTLNDTTIFKGSEFFLSLLLPHFTNSGCNDSLIRVTVNRTLVQQTKSSHLVIANYTILIEVKEEYRLNSSILSGSTGKKIDKCYDTIIDDAILEERFLSYFALNISGDRLKLNYYFVHEPTQNLKCKDGMILCPDGSTNVAQMCECSKGTYLDVNLKNCKKCPEDQYQNMTGMFNCTACQPGHTTFNKTGSNKSEDCQLGRDVYVLAIVLPVSVVVLIIFAAIVIFVLYPRKKRQEYRKSFGQMFLRKTVQYPTKRDVEANNYQGPKSRTTQNEFYEESPNNSDNEIEEASSSILGYLAEDVARCDLEIPRDQITETRVRLGRGHFGEVRQIILRKPDQPETLCAAKMSRGSQAPVADMLDELEIHLKLEDVHENVVNLIGVCSSQGGPFYLIVEYCDNGSLLEYLRKHEPIPEYVNLEKRETLSLEWKLRCTLEICRGMEYLAKNKIVHRDLAARNVLLDKDTKAKISDFGMAKDVYLKSYYTQTHQGSFPLRWMACESIMKMEFTEKTDVWSFGVLVWEIFTDGTLPYYRIINDEKVALYILSGKTLKRPESCPKILYSNIMLKCWGYKSFDRPKFWELCKTLEQNTNKLLHNEKGRSLQSRLGRDVFKRFNETKRSLKRRMSRKGSKQSVDALPHASSRKLSQASLDRLSNDSESQRTRELNTNMFFNPGADSDIPLQASPFLKKKPIKTPKNNDENIEMLDVMQENGIEESYSKGRKDSTGIGPQSSANDDTENDSLNTNEIGLQPGDSCDNNDVNNNDGLREITPVPESITAAADSFDIESNDEQYASKDLEKPNSNRIRDNEFGCNDFLSKTSERSSPVDTNRFPDTESKNIDIQRPEIPSESSSHTNDDNEHGKQSMTNNLDELSDNSCEDVEENYGKCSADITDTFSKGMSSYSETELDDSCLTDQNMDENNDEYGDIKIKNDEDESDSFEAQDLENVPHQTRSEDAKQSSEESDSLSDVLNAVNGGFQEQEETVEDTANSSSC
ncbi:tyrosine-protein kinase abl-1-like isoform X2 [Dendronephthya gigantea]|uniref:tyrosine-protein kinase abl-1-like isoform X2 n=1 Tax=Dendronephthya gigantea TaxID=151771 RepID=UPI00106D1783|nr:tyrosine-protein kinase abl-1-like isoform X2 [Dendronephthya gigantea]